MNGKAAKNPTTKPSTSPARRSFLAALIAILAGGLALLPPVAAGLGVLLSPLRRRAADGSNGGAADDGVLVRIGPLDALAADDVPRPFPVTADAADAWTRTVGQRVGMVFVARASVSDKPRVTAFTATCPHLGCAVEFNGAERQFQCPCHKSAFGADGQKLFGPSLRGLDPLEVRLIDNKGQPDVWVVFRRFRTGVAERIPVA